MREPLPFRIREATLEEINARLDAACLQANRDYVANMSFGKEKP